MKKIYSVDRIEEQTAVVVCDDESVFTVNKEKLCGLKEGDVFSAEETDGELTCITPMPEEKERREKEARARLHRLFGRGKR